MAETQGWQQVFKPFLESRRDQTYPNPLEFKDEKEFLYAAQTASIFKHVIQELLAWVDGQINQAKHLKAKEKGEIVNKFRIGGDQ